MTIDWLRTIAPNIAIIGSSPPRLRSTNTCGVCEWRRYHAESLSAASCVPSGLSSLPAVGKYHTAFARRCSTISASVLYESPNEIHRPLPYSDLQDPLCMHAASSRSASRASLVSGTMSCSVAVSVFLPRLIPKACPCRRRMSFGRVADRCCRKLFRLSMHCLPSILVVVRVAYRMDSY
ncbi:hypothetical protein A0H81_05626 [Grifola frondosa]|uniref:Uncharacterized protein n=1 Tax=Grifola frondosa TaxID=5627 RepID=A0A1C7MBL8_GRIFR|nr:hypothetical protein A0H81_05626 [Grifola frondosa]